MIIVRAEGRVKACSGSKEYNDNSHGRAGTYDSVPIGQEPFMLLLKMIIGQRYFSRPSMSCRKHFSFVFDELDFLEGTLVRLRGLFQATYSFNAGAFRKAARKKLESKQV